jgi:hypothetical protein
MALVLWATPSRPSLATETTSTCEAPSNAASRLPGSAKSPRRTRTPRGQILSAIGVTDTDPDLVGREPVEQSLDDLRAELAGCSCDDDHAYLRVSGRRTSRSAL